MRVVIYKYWKQKNSGRVLSVEHGVVMNPDNWEEITKDEFERLQDDNFKDKGDL